MSTTQVKSEEDQNMADTDSGVESTASASTSTTSIDQVNDPEFERKKRAFYGDFADGRFRCKDGKIIIASKAILSTESKIFHELVVETKRRVIDVPEHDEATFKLFLDCLMKFKKITFDDALIIFPVALKYETKELIDNCIAVLTPTAVNKNVSLALNLAATHWILLNPVLNFLCEKQRVNKFIEDEECYLLLGPEAMYLLLLKVEVDSFVLKNVFKWGQQYLKNRNMKMDLKSFFEKHDIDLHISVNCFESAKSYFEFIETDLGKDFFSSEDFQEFIKDSGFISKESKWVNITAGETFTEEFIIPDLAHLNNHVTDLFITDNKIKFYEFPDDKNASMIKYNYCCHFNNCSNSKTFTGSFYSDSSDVLRCSESLMEIKWSKNIVADLSVKTEFVFNYDCRILKATPKNFQPKKNSNDHLFFTRSIDVTYEKIKC